jgi:hypothetical protein
LFLSLLNHPLKLPSLPVPTHLQLEASEKPKERRPTGSTPSPGLDPAAATFAVVRGVRPVPRTAVEQIQWANLEDSQFFSAAVLIMNDFQRVAS